MRFFVIRFDTFTLQDVYMPVMNGLQTTKLIRSYEETGNWDAAREAGVEQSISASDECFVPPKKRIHIVAVSNYILIFTNIQTTTDNLGSYREISLRNCVQGYIYTIKKLRKWFLILEHVSFHINTIFY
jgi:hypothetical protein